MGQLYYIMGKSASGKDTIFKMLTEDPRLGFRKLVPYTTRPIRAGEEEGIAYHFVDDQAFARMKDEGKVIESRTYQTVFGPWHYFTADDGQLDFSKDQGLMIGTLESYRQMFEYLGGDVIVPVYIEVPDGLRYERAVAREMQQTEPNLQEVERRFKADALDFSEEKLQEAGITKRYLNDDLKRCYEEIVADILR